RVRSSPPSLGRRSARGISSPPARPCSSSERSSPGTRKYFCNGDPRFPRYRVEKISPTGILEYSRVAESALGLGKGADPTGGERQIRSLPLHLRREAFLRRRRLP